MQTMKAVVYHRFGGPEVLTVEDIGVPAAGPTQVRVRVRAAAVNPFDCKVRSGRYGGDRFPRIPGVEVAGVVDQVGADVRGVAPGQAVLGWAVGGGCAEQAVLERFAEKPEDMPWEVAASLPVSAEAARRGLDLLDVGARETLLIHGAAGSVGGIAVQLAVARGATVVGTAGEDHHDHLRELGAVPTRYGDGLVERVAQLAPGGVDAVFDVAGRGALPASIELRGGTERIVTIADPDAEAFRIPFSSGGTADQSRAALADVLSLFRRGRLTVPIRRRLPLADVAVAHRLVEAGHGRGKVVLVP